MMEQLVARGFVQAYEHIKKSKLTAKQLIQLQTKTLCSVEKKDHMLLGS